MDRIVCISFVFTRVWGFSFNFCKVGLRQNQSYIDTNYNFLQIDSSLVSRQPNHAF